MAVHLVRHAIAVGRSAWDRSDVERPLTARGRRQAEGLVKLLDDAPVRRVLSSPAVRCRDTVVPLAEARGLEVQPAAELAEGRGTKPAVELLVAQAAKKGDSVLCAHGDLIPEILRNLVRHGVRLDDELQFAKGSTWELAVTDGKITSARYHPPTE